jgi:hypothetical protein
MKFNFISDLDLKSPEIYLFLDRGVSNSLDNNLMFAEPGNMTVETNLDSYILLNNRIKNHDLYEEYKRSATVLKMKI